MNTILYQVEWGDNLTYEQYLRNRENRLRNGNKGDCNCDCNGVGEENSCCSGSRLRPPGIKSTGTSGVYFADADLECGVLCSGSDSDTIYEWSLTPVPPISENPPKIVGNSRKVGNDRVEVAGTGTFDLHVRVTFHCNALVETKSCVREATVRFTQ